MKVDYLAIGDAAAELGIPSPTLRRYCDMGVIPVKRASDGSRLFSPETIEAARTWLRQHRAVKKKASTRTRRDTA